MKLGEQHVQTSTPRASCAPTRATCSVSSSAPGIADPTRTEASGASPRTGEQTEFSCSGANSRSPQDCVREAEASEGLGGVEDGDVGDAGAGVDCEHLDRMRAAAACRVQLVGAEGELAVCADWQVAPSRATRERQCSEERADGGTASIPVRP